MINVATEAATPAYGNPSSAIPSRTKLRRSLRASIKLEEEKDPLPSPLLTKRGGRQSGVSRSLSVLNKSDKPARRLSGSVKSQSSVGMLVPVSDNSKKKSPESGIGISKITGRRKFNILSSASYWVAQIRLSEIASKHSISLGFFKLALECECEPFQLVRDEFREYAVKYKILLELGEFARDLLEKYDILEAVENMQLSEKNQSSPHRAIQVMADKKGRISRKSVPATSSSTKSNRASPRPGTKKMLIAKSIKDSSAPTEKDSRRKLKRST